MFENRNLKHDLLALGLLALVIFLGLSLLTYDPADRLGNVVFPLDRLYNADVLVYPESEQIGNACGRLGALAANVLLNGLGIGAHFLVVSLGVLTWRLLARRPIDSPILRLIGWAASLFGLVTLAAMFLSALSSGPVIGAGGYLGAAGRGLFESHFAAVGGLILSLSLIAGGLLLCTDYALIQVALLVCAATADGLMTGRRFITGRGRSEEGEKGEGEGRGRKRLSGLSIRIRGRQVDAQEEEELEKENDQTAEEAEDEPEEEEGEAPEEQEELTAAKKRLTLRRHKQPRPKLRVRTPGTKKEKKPDGREEVIEQLEHASQTDNAEEYELPSMDLLLTADEFSYEVQEQEVRSKAKVLEQTFESFGFHVKVVEIETGPVIAQYEVELESGLRLSRITGLADDLAIALRVPSVRIVAPIPGKNTVGIEVPNEERQVVRLREVMEEVGGRAKKMRIPIFLGKDVSGNPLSVDLSSLPHLLIAGRTGTGKSVCLNAIIASILMTRRPDEVRMLMIDPKMVELSGYRSLPHLMHPVVTDMRKAEAILAWAVDKMEQRYELLARAGVRHLSVYNQLGKEELMDRLQPEDDEQRDAIPLQLPYIVIIADEIADLIMTSGKEVEQSIIRLAQKSRAVGIHLILATQKPTVDVITGLIKSNLPARIAFQVASRVDSRVVLDEMGADRLLGNGDMLFLWPGTSTLLRGQGTYLSDDEINGIVDAVSTGEQNFVKELVHLKVEDSSDGSVGILKKRDDLYEAAVDVVVREGRGSVSLLQRAMGIGYGRAARLIDFMAEDGIVGEYAGSQAREVLITLADWERMQGNEVEAEPEPETARKPRRSNKIVPYDAPEEEREEELEEEAAGEYDEEVDEDAEDEDAKIEDEAEDEAEYEYEEEDEPEDDAYQAESA